MHEREIAKYFKPDLRRARKRTRTTSERIDFHIDDQDRTLGLNRTFLIHTYGCQANEADSEIMAGILGEIGFEKAASESEADMIILNTCAIRENAENRIWGELGRLKAYKRHNPDLILALAGCMPQEEYVVERVLKKYPHVDIVFGTHNIHRMPDYIRTALFSKERVIEVYSQEGAIVESVPKLRAHPYKAWVHIMYGCDEFCTYCIVPYTRGKERSRSREDILSEVRELKDKGYREVTLLGQNVNAYGKDFADEGYTFGDLLNELDRIGIDRIRFATSHPHDLDRKTMEAMANGEHIMPYFHLPVQSGSDGILKKMNRHYTRQEYLDVLEELKETVPGISVTTDIIVGFPGETEKDFEDTLDLVKRAQFEGAFTFIYSKREGTPAARFPDETSEDEKKRRLQRLNKLVNEQYLAGSKRFEKTVVKVLVEGKSKHGEKMMFGYTEHNKLVNFEGKQELVGQLIDVRITRAMTWYLMGEIV
ncbi:MAG: tRNA (N6-isopentenyl adenosine(37)-C2)-methylthiotransferase MiaB [Acholeplasmataceae bacterium]